MKTQITFALACATALMSLASQAALAKTTTVTPTGTSSDFATLQGVIDAADPGDVIVLENRDGGNSPASFNFSAMTSNGIVISTPFLTIRGEYEAGPPQVVATLDGPSNFDAGNSWVAFTVNPEARGLTIENVLFDTFEAAVVLEEGVQSFTFRNSGTVDCANGIFGVGDNDRMWIDRCILDIVATPLGGNAGVTVQEGSDRVAVLNSTIKGPGVAQASLAIAGIIDFNTGSPAIDHLFANNVIRKFDAGIYASSSVVRVQSNKVVMSDHGISLVSEVDGGSLPLVNATVSFNEAKSNAIGISLFGVKASILADNTLSGNTTSDISCQSTTTGTGSTFNKLTRNSGTDNCGAASLSAGPVLSVRAVRP